MPRPNQSSPLAIGLQWVSRITALALEFVLPLVAGHLIDARLDTAPLATIVGACLGFALGLYHVIQLAKKPPDPGSA